MMKAIKVKATVDEEGSLLLDQPLSNIQNNRVEVIILIPETVDIDEDDEQIETREEILQDFRQAWHEAMTEQTIPISEVWEGIENVRSNLIDEFEMAQINSDENLQESLKRGRTDVKENRRRRIT